MGARPRRQLLVRRGFRRLAILTATGSACGGALLIGSAACVEWRITTHAVPPGAISWQVIALALAAPGLAIALMVSIAPFLVVYHTRRERDPLPVLADIASRTAAEGWVSIPYADRDDEIGDLARALREWQHAALLREVLLRSAPVGIFRLDRMGVVQDTNLASQVILGYTREALEGRGLMEIVHPDDHHLAAGMTTEALAAAGRDRAEVEVRMLRGDGTWLWCSGILAPVGREQELPDSYIVILEDIGERKRQAEWAAGVQREMLPGSAPRLKGYEVAASFQPAQEVAGDLYDWVDTGDGHLDLTVADVMGKGMGSALVMAALRTALRTAPGELGPAARVTRAAESMTFGSGTEGLFVTLFHGRLEVATGRLRYVDAGHGYCAIRRADGEIERLGTRSMPLGAGLGEVFEEGVVRLEPGDTLLVCSDGLMEVGDRTARIEELAPELEGADSAEETMRRLVARVSGRPTDDATAVVLRRLGSRDRQLPPASGGAGGRRAADGRAAAGRAPAPDDVAAPSPAG
jgi:PAS domain S-box-containing protein